MGGGKKVTYNPPKIEKDKSFEKYLQYQMDRDEKAETRAQTEREEAKKAEDARKAAGKNAYDAYASNIQSQLGAGLISFNDAQSRLEGYRSKYDMVPGKK